MQKRWFNIWICLFLAIGGFASYFIINGTSLPTVDMVEVNRIVKNVTAGFEYGRFSKPEDCPYDYTVLDSAGRVLYTSGERASLNVREAVRIHDAILDIREEDTVYGKVLIATNYAGQLLELRRKLACLALGMCGGLMGLALLYGRYLNRKLFKPFEALQGFARHIAMGNLEVPLPMDRDHVFGAFTESFDIMREELALARQREADANRSKKELVASLSHDIKTPVTSIKLVSELLLVTEQGTPAAGKIQTIYEKAEQIDKLITDMLHATLEDLGELKVQTEETSSEVLETMIRNSDYYGKVTMDSIPGCLLLLDPLRMEQVIDNVISNSYKYAGTGITIHTELMEGGLRLEFRDYGDGVPEEELPKLIQKFYRGTNSQTSGIPGSGTLGSGIQGSGLGLYISHYLMEQMGGELQYYNREDGFSVEIFIRLT